VKINPWDSVADIMPIMSQEKIKEIMKGGKYKKHKLLNQSQPAA
jgi:hypothetical protein